MLENMAYFIQNDGTKAFPFGMNDTATKLQEEFAIDSKFRLPLSETITKSNENGSVFVLEHPKSDETMVRGLLSCRMH